MKLLRVLSCCAAIVQIACIALFAAFVDGHLPPRVDSGIGWYDAILRPVAAWSYLILLACVLLQLVTKDNERLP